MIRGGKGRGHEGKGDWFNFFKERHKRWEMQQKRRGAFPKFWVAGGSPSLLSPLVENPVILATPSLLWKKIDPPPSWAN